MSGRRQPWVIFATALQLPSVFDILEVKRALLSP